MSTCISYIIPVYNGAKYLPHCLNSLYRQGLTENEFEVICIDDCSTDGSVSILKDYEDSHSNFKLILHTHNKKTGTSCNDGLKAATGEYIWIIGQDDWIENDCGQKLATEVHLANLDLVLFNYCQRKDDSQQAISADKVFANSPIMRGKEFVRTYFENSFCAYLLGFEWRALYRREYLLNAGIGFTDGAIYEDTTFLFRATWYSNKVKSLDNFIYNYRVNEESITDANKRFKGLLAYEFAFVAGKEVLDLSKELEGTKESALLYRQALWYFRSFIYKVIPMPLTEKKIFYSLVNNNWASVKVMLDLCPVYARYLASPKSGIVLSSLLKPLFIIKHFFKKKTYGRGI